MFRITGSVTKYPARASLFWYAGLIVLGSCLLVLPASRGTDAEPISWLEAAFSSTSATCVTGLVVRSTEHDFSFWGQLVLLVLIQIGGLGIMTVTTFVVFQMGARETLRYRAALADSLGADSEADLRWILGNVLIVSLVIEGTGFLILAARNLFDQPFHLALWRALFHSVSAFCNAGFALHDDSLTRYQCDPLVNLTISALVITGGIGFPVILDLRRNWQLPWPVLWNQLCVHSKLMLIGTVSLLVGGTLMMLLLEWDGILAPLPYAARPLVAFFHSVSARTAGFNTVNMAQLTNASLFITILLMLVGAGACSTAGGFKVSTLMLLICQARAAFQGHSRVSVFRRTISVGTVQRAMVTTMLFLVVAFAGLTVLLVLEQSNRPHQLSRDAFLDAFFEVSSAIGTVGLSTGITPVLGKIGKIVIILLMFFGRLGPITVFAALSRSAREDRIEFPSESVLTG